MSTRVHRGGARGIAAAGAVLLASLAGAPAQAQPIVESPPAKAETPTLAIPKAAHASGPLRPDEFRQVISNDPYRNPESQHRTEVEADTVNVGNNVVATFQVGRNFSGGAANIGWAASSDGGVTWGHSFLPGITHQAGGPWPAASDPVVAVDVKHQVWLISSLAITADKDGRGVYTSRAFAGQDFQNPIWTLGNDGNDWDKNWVTCDNSPRSPYFGTCYTVANLSGARELVITVSHDGGATWSAPRVTEDRAMGVGAQPVVLPNGTLVVPYLDHQRGEIRYFRSFDGGATFRASEFIDQHRFYQQPAGEWRVRDGLGVPNVEVDGGGRVYVVWPDCRFQEGCTGNDIIMARSTSFAGLTSATADQPISWDTPQQVPLPAGAMVAAGNSIVPGIGADKDTGWSNARIGLFFYWVSENFIYLAYNSSTNGGDTWAGVKLADGASVVHLPRTSIGLMVGDYLSVSMVEGGTRALTAYAMGRYSDADLDVPMHGIRGTVNGGTLAGDTVAVSQRPDQRGGVPASLR